MTLPASRNRTYAPNSPVRSADLNDIQDNIVGGKHGDKILTIAATAGEVATAAGGAWNLAAGFGVVGHAWVSPSLANLSVSFSLPLHIGDRIKSVRALVKDTAGGHTLDMQLVKSTSTFTQTQIGTTQTSAGDGSDQTLSVSGLTATIASGNFYYVVVGNNDTTVTTHRIYGVEVTYDRP